MTQPPSVEVSATAAGAGPAAPAPPPSIHRHSSSGQPHGHGHSHGHGHGHRHPSGSVALPAPVFRRVVRVDATGAVSHVLVDRYVLSDQLGLPFRDLRVLDPKTPSTAGAPAAALPAAAILIRERALGFAMEGVRAIVCADQVLVLGAPTGGAAVVSSGTHLSSFLNPHMASPLLPPPSKHPHAALAASPFVRDLCARIRQEGRSGTGVGVDATVAGGSEAATAVAAAAGTGTPGEASPSSPSASTPVPSASSAPLPYELRATEAVLLAAVRRLDGEVGALEAGAGPDLDRLGGGALGRDDLLRLRGHKAALGRLLARAAGVRGALESLLDDDGDLANLYLGRRASRAAALAAATAAAAAAGAGAQGAVPEEEEEEEGEGGEAGGEEAPGPPSSPPPAESTGPPQAQTPAAQPPPPSFLPRTDTGTGRRATAGTARGTDCGSEAGTATAIWARGAGPGGCWFGNAAAHAAGLGLPGAPGGHHPSPLEECEGAANLLDAYAALAGGSLARLEALRDRVAASEALVRLELDRRRNELVAFNMFLSMVSVCVGVVSAIGSVFGQNLYFSSHETPLAAWHAATWGSVGVAAAGMAGLLAYARRHNLLFIPTTDE